MKFIIGLLEVAHPAQEGKFAVEEEEMIKFKFL